MTELAAEEYRVSLDPIPLFVERHFRVIGAGP